MSTGQNLYETYLAATGWAPTPKNAWKNLEANRQRAWEKASTAAREEQCMPTGAIKIYAAMLEAVSLAP
jgi:hypothetical protein